ncbi:hypothetical protein GN956_G25915 [Arapaima gigas]
MEVPAQGERHPQEVYGMEDSVCQGPGWKGTAAPQCHLVARGGVVQHRDAQGAEWRLSPPSVCQVLLQPHKPVSSSCSG